MRQACDRCHAKKTKCPKHPGASSCIRCAKAGAPCNFSPTTTRSTFQQYEPPPRQTFRQYEPPGPIASGIQPQNTVWEHRWQQQNGNIDMDDMMAQSFQPWPNHQELPVDPSLTPEIPMDPSLGADPVDPSLTTAPEAMDPRLVGEASPEHQQQTETEDPSTQPDVKQLMDFMVVLDATHRSLPSNEAPRTSQEDVKHWVDTMTSQVDLKMRLESILDHTSNLGILYSSIMKLAARDEEAQVANGDGTKDSLCSDFTAVPSIDYALLNVLVACHMKLLDIIDLILGLGRVCGQAVSQLPKDQEPTFDIPEIRVGKFVATKEKAATYFVTFLTDLLGSLHGFLGALESMAESDGKSQREAQVLGLQCEMLKDRTDGAVKGLHDLQEDMTKRGIIHQ